MTYLVRPRGSAERRRWRDDCANCQLGVNAGDPTMFEPTKRPA